MYIHTGEKWRCKETGLIVTVDSIARNSVWYHVPSSLSLCATNISLWLESMEKVESLSEYCLECDHTFTPNGFLFRFRLPKKEED